MKLLPIAAALFAALPISLAGAQPWAGQERRVLRYEEEAYSSPSRGGYEQVCMRWCPHDAVPCDPPHFKIADGRCRDRRGNR